MMRLWAFSDLHQEWPDNAFDPLRHAPDAFDVIAVAGDVNTPGTRAVDWLADRFAGVPIVYVLGNHDLYCNREEPFTCYDIYEQTRERGAARGVHVLVDETIVLCGVRFLGGTLWTDMRHRTFSRGHAFNTARKGMNDYRKIRRRRTGRHHNLRVEDTIAMHRATVGFLDAALAVPFDGPSVVVTHHAPSSRSLADPTMDLSWCYVSGFLDLVEHHQVDLWLHGHLHSHSDYRLGGCRVVANPRGHVEEAATAGFIADLVIEVGLPAS